MKKILTAVLSMILCLTFILSGCGENPTPTDTSSSTQMPKEAEQAMEAAYESLFGGVSKISTKKDLEIPEEIDGIKIKFRSSNTNLVGNDGEIFRREYSAETAATVTLEYDGYEIKKDITIVVIGTNDDQSSTEDTSSSSSSSAPIVTDPIENKVITIDENETGYPKIAKIKMSGEYTTIGFVSAVSKRSFILSDETGNILVMTSETPDVTIGDAYKVSGKVSRYAKSYRFDEGASVKLTNTSITRGQTEPMFIDAAMSAEINSAADISATYVEIRGVLRNVNGTSTLTIDGSTNVCSIADGADLSDYYNKEVTVKGYLTGVNNIYLQVILTDIYESGEETAPTKIAISGTDKIYVGESFRFAAIFAPSNANCGKHIIWSSSDEYVAKVDSFGNVTGISAGNVTIKASLLDGSAVATMSITILKSKPINATSISYDKVIRVKTGSTLTISPKIEPENANAGTTVKYEIDDESVATVSQSGVISAKGEGATKVTMTLENGQKATSLIFVSEDLLAGYSIPEIVENTNVQPVTNEEDLYKVIDNAITSRASITYISSELDLSALKLYVLNYSDNYCRGESFVLSMFIGDYDENYRLAIDFCMTDDYGERYTDLSDESICNEIPNALTLLREAEASKDRYCRSETFENFPICTSNNGKRTVYNTEELVWALSRNYMPIFPVSGTKAEHYFEKAKDILRDIITYDMNDTQKVRAIFDYVCEHTAFDFDMTVFNANRRKYANVHLESAMEDGYCISEGMTKMFIMLCRIEGIEAVLGHGYAKGGTSDVWAYAKIDGKWYAFSLSEAQAMLNSSDSVSAWIGDGKASFTNYGYFGTGTTLKCDEYPNDQNWREIDKTSTEILKDGLSDMWISTTENARTEIRSLFERINNAGISGAYFVTLASDEAIIDADTLYAAIYSAGIDAKVALSKSTINGITFTTVFVNTNK